MKTALVTGGARRIGRAIVECLVRNDFGVAIHCSRSRPQAESLRDAIIRTGGRACVVQGDLAQSRSAPDIISNAASALGPLTLLVNNASVFEADELGTLNVDVWERQLAINLRAPVFLTREFARQLPVDGQGAVVNIIDQRVWRPTPHFFSYSLSKAALLTATQTMAQALAPRVRVNAVGPGRILPHGHQTIEDFAQAKCSRSPSSRR